MKLTLILDAKGREVATISPDSTVRDAVELLAGRGIGAAVVSADGAAVAGIFSERDVVRLLAERGAVALSDRLGDVMTSRVHCASGEHTIDELMTLMTTERIRHVPVLDAEGRLDGIVSIGDAVKARLGELEDERTALLGYITTGG